MALRCLGGFLIECAIKFVALLMALTAWIGKEHRGATDGLTTPATRVEGSLGKATSGKRKRVAQ